jgi:hypothetical protein
MNKICPMMPMPECVEENCGWWDSDLNKCSMASIADSLDIIASELDNTAMPTAYSEVPD